MSLAVLGVLALLTCIVALWATIKLGNEQEKSQENYYQSKRTYSTLAYIYAAFMVLVFLFLAWYLA